MKFKSNARWSEPKENGTIFELKNNGLRIKIHRFWRIYMSSNDFGSKLFLTSDEAEKALKEMEE